MSWLHFDSLSATETPMIFLTLLPSRFPIDAFFLKSLGSIPKILVIPQNLKCSLSQCLLWVLVIFPKSVTSPKPPVVPVPRVSGCLTCLSWVDEGQRESETWKHRKWTQKQLVLTFVPLLNFSWFLCSILCLLDLIVGLLIRVFPIHVELLPSFGMKL